MNDKKHSNQSSTNYVIDENKRLIISAGAAAASNDTNNAARVVASLRAAGVPDEKIQHAISIGRNIRCTALGHINEMASNLMEASPRKSSDAGCGCNDVAVKALCLRTTLLTMTSAAMAAPCEPCLRNLLPKLKRAGVSSGDILVAIEIGMELQQTVNMREVKTLSDVCDAEKEAVEAEACGCGC